MQMNNHNLATEPRNNNEIYIFSVLCKTVHLKIHYINSSIEVQKYDFS